MKASYVQDKKTGEVSEIEVSDANRKDPDWGKRYRRVRLLHDATRGVVFCEDYDLPSWWRSFQAEGFDNVDLDTFESLKLLYANPDL